MEKFSPDTNSSEANRVVPVLDKVIQFSLFTFAVFSMFSISVTQISFAIGALAWLLKTHLTKSWKELRGTMVGIAILFFCLACVLAVATSVDLESSIKHLKKLLQFIIFFWVANAVQDEKQRDLLIGLVIAAGAVTALNGLTPFLNGEFPANRITGTMSQESTFAGLLVFSGLVALGRFLFHKPKEYWVLGSLGIISLCLLLTLTRQAWLSFFIGTVFLLFFWSKKYLLLLPLLLAGLLLFAPDKVVDRMSSLTDLQDHSFQARVSIWKEGWQIFKDHPVTGCGFKCVDAIHPRNYTVPSGRSFPLKGMHSSALQLLVDTGIVGLGAWLSIWAAYFMEIFKRFRTLAEKTSQGNDKGLLMVSSVAVLAYLVGGFFDTSVYDSEVSMPIYFLMGLSLAQLKKASRAE